MRRTTLTLLLLTSLAFAAPSVVLAQDGPAAEEEAYRDLTAQATAAYEAGDYAKAVDLFQQAYALRPVSNILYNIGRIYEDMGDIDNAIKYYDQFVVSPNVEQTSRRDALERSKTLREVRQLQQGEPEEPQEQVATTPAPTPAPAPRSNLGRTLGWTFLGVGGASLIGAGVFGLLTQEQHSRFEDASSLQDRRDAASAGGSLAVVADTMLIVGAVSAITGGVLLIASTGGDESARMTVTPLVGQHAWGLGLDMNF